MGERFSDHHADHNHHPSPEVKRQEPDFMKRITERTKMVGHASGFSTMFSMGMNGRDRRSEQHGK